MAEYVQHLEPQACVRNDSVVFPHHMQSVKRTKNGLSPDGVEYRPVAKKCATAGACAARVAGLDSAVLHSPAAAAAASRGLLFVLSYTGLWQNISNTPYWHI
jgi:hypothetical protein